MHLRNRQLIQQLEADTAALALPEGRRVGQPGHDVAREYLLGRLENLGLVPFRGDSFELRYEGTHPRTRKNQRFANLVGVIPGEDRNLAPILLGAHYDSVIDAPCADDNATSVAMNLAIAEDFLQRPLQRDLIIALFDAEEPPHFLGPTMGSTRFHEDHCADVDFAAVIVSDLIGHDLKLSDLGVDVPGVDLMLPHARDVVFLLGAESDAVFPDIVEEIARETKKLRVFPTLNRYVGNLSDHHSFAKQGQPFLFLSCAQGRYYHDERDTLDWINFSKLARITEFVTGLIEKIDETPGDPYREPVDPLDFELRMIREAVGPPLRPILKSFGITMPESREEMDALMGMLV